MTGPRRLPRRAVCAALLLGEALRRTIPEAAAQGGPPPLPPDPPPRRVSPGVRGGTAGSLRVELLAPDRGTGMTAQAQPMLYFLLSRPLDGRAGLTIMARGARGMLADTELPGATMAGLNPIRLQALGIRLPPDSPCTWSLVVPAGRTAPPLVCSGLLRYRPAPASLEATLRGGAPLRRAQLLLEADYWYDAVAAAVEARSQDGGALLRRLLNEAGLGSWVQAGAL